MPGDGALGPNLRGGDSVNRFPVVEDQFDFIFDGSDFEVPYGNQGLGTGRMPGFGLLLSADQIHAIVNYERGIDADTRTGATVGDTTGTSAQDTSEDLPADTTKAENEQQQIDEQDD